MRLLAAVARSQTAAALVLLWIGIAAVSVGFDDYWIGIAVGVVTWIMLAVSWNMVGGLLGQISFGHAAFYGIGAYATVYLSTAFGLTPWLGLAAGGMVAALAALALGYIPFRWNLSTLVFALLTLAFSYMLLFAVSGISELGGTNGLFPPAVGQTLWDFRFESQAAYLVVIGVLTTMLLVTVQVLYSGRLGYYWRAIHDNEPAAAAIGIDIVGIKQLTFAISAFFAALAGGFSAQHVGFIDPQSVFGIDITIYVLLFAVVGGAGTLLGPIIGPLILVPAGEWLRTALADMGGSSANHLVYGVALMAAILAFPGGLVAGLRRFGVTRGALTPPPSPEPAREVDRALGGTQSGNAVALLTATGLSKSFGGVAAVRDVSFDAIEGEILGIIGPNGAGKTTLFSLLAGSHAPTGGMVTFGGRTITGLAPGQICAAGMGRTFQITQAFPSLTVIEVLYAAALVGRSAAEASGIAARVLAQTGLAQHRDTESGRLTLAVQRRLEIGRALATQPRLLLLDEIMAGLTPREIDGAIALIRAIRASGVTVIFIEHHIRAVMALCDRVLVLDAGELISQGTPAEVARDPRVVEAYLGEPTPARAPRAAGAPPTGAVLVPSSQGSAS